MVVVCLRSLIDVHVARLGRSRLRRWSRGSAILLSRFFLGRRGSGRLRNRLGFGFGEDRRGEVHQLFPLLLDFFSRDDRGLALWLLSLSRELVLQPFLGCRRLFNDRLQLLGLNVRVSLFTRGRLRHVLIDGITQERRGARQLLVFLPPEDDGVAECLERIGLFSVGRLGSVLSFLGVKPFLCLGEEGQ